MCINKKRQADVTLHAEPNKKSAGCMEETGPFFVRLCIQEQRCLRKRGQI